MKFNIFKREECDCCHKKKRDTKKCVVGQNRIFYTSNLCKTCTAIYRIQGYKILDRPFPQTSIIIEKHSFMF